MSKKPSLNQVSETNKNKKTGTKGSKLAEELNVQKKL